MTTKVKINLKRFPYATLSVYAKQRGIEVDLVNAVLPNIGKFSVEFNVNFAKLKLNSVIYSEKIGQFAGGVVYYSIRCNTGFLGSRVFFGELAVTFNDINIAPFILSLFCVSSLYLKHPKLFALPVLQFLKRYLVEDSFFSFEVPMGSNSCVKKTSQ